MLFSHRTNLEQCAYSKSKCMDIVHVFTPNLPYYNHTEGIRLVTPKQNQLEFPCIKILIQQEKIKQILATDLKVCYCVRSHLYLLRLEKEITIIRPKPSSIQMNTIFLSRTSCSKDYYFLSLLFMFDNSSYQNNSIHKETL